MKKEMTNREIIGELAKRVAKIKIEEVVGKYIKLTKKGANYTGLCPFHNDSGAGSFKTSSSLNICKCFSCGGGGNPISFIIKMEGVTFVEAVLILATDHKIITIADADRIRGKKKVDYSRAEVKAQKTEDSPKKDNTELINSIFSLFINNIKLSGRDRKYLKSRGLSDEAIDRAKYKTYPSKIVTESIINLIKHEYGTLDVLMDVPGFYQEKKGSGYKWVLPELMGILIPIKDENGKIRGLQIRKYQNQEGQNRYMWLSSSFADGGENGCNGTSSGAPLDVIYPEVLRNKAIFVTEGKFKAEKIAQTYGSVVLSVQGVASWKDILPTIKNIDNNIGGEDYKIECIYIAFDADIASKPPVWQQAKAMTDVLQSAKFPVYYLNWEEEKGKGIDDVINNGNIKGIYKYEKDAFDGAYNNVIEKAIKKEKEKGNSIETVQEIKTEIFKTYYNKYMKLTPLKKGEISKHHEQRIIEIRGL